MNASFALDKPNGRMMGVCAGLARSSGVDATVIRIAALLSILIIGYITIPAYIVAGLVAPSHG